MRNWQTMGRLCAIALAVLAGIAATPVWAAKPKVSKLTILYTTDLYGQMRDFRCKRVGTPAANDYEAAPRDISNLLYQVNRIRKKVIAKNDPDPLKPPDHGVLLFNTGDNLATATAARFLLEFKGIAGVDFIANVFARFGYSLIGIGNHEFSVRPEKLKAFIQQSRLKDLKFSAANLLSSPPNHVFTKEVNHDSVKKTKYFIFQEASLKIGVFHVVPEGMETKVAFANGLKFGSPSSAIEKIVPILRKKEKVDLVIMMSHLDNKTKGKNIRELLATYSDDPEKRIDLVITNGLRESGKPLSTITLSGRNSSYIVGGYKYGTQLGRVDLRVRHTKKGSRLESFNVQSVPVNDALYDPGLRRELTKWERSYCKRWGKPLGQGRLRKDMERGQFVKYFLNYMRRLGQGEIAMINKGAIPEEKPFPFQGYITKDDLYRAIPFPQDIYIREVTGAELNAMSNKDSLEFVGFDGSNVNGRPVVENGKYRLVAIKYVAGNRGGWFGDVKGKKALKKWKPVQYKNGKVPEIRRMMIAHFATNNFRSLPYTPAPKPEPPDDDNAKKKPPKIPKPFGINEIPYTGNFLRLNEWLAWEFKTGFVLSFESIFANPTNLSGFYGDSQSFSNQFFQKYQINGEWNFELKFHTNQHEWNNKFVVGYTAYASRVLNSETAEETPLYQEERDEIKFESKYILKPFGSAERKWYHTNPFVRSTLQTEVTAGNRPDLTSVATIFNPIDTSDPNKKDLPKKFFQQSGESELYHRFRIEAEAGLTFNIEKANLNIDISFAFRKQFALNPFTATKPLGATEADLTINTDANIGLSAKAELSELQLFKVNKTPFVWVSSARYTLLFQVGAFTGFADGLVTHDFEWKNKFAFKLQGNVELAFGLDVYLYQGIFKPDPEKNVFQQGPFAFRLDPKVSLNVSWGARGQAY